jgi:hypothetical protein
MSENPIEKGITGVVQIYELLDRVRTRRDLVIRDDQFDTGALLEAAQYAARRGIGLSVLDTGRLGLVELEALARSGSRILTTDEARPRAGDLEILQDACRRAGTHLGVFWNGPLPAGDGSTEIPSQALEHLLERGLDLHVSNRVRPREAGPLAALSAAAKKGRGFFVIYHLGPLTPELAGPAAGRAWIHLSDASIEDASSAAMGVAIARAAAAAGSRAAVHIERGLELEVLEALWEAGAALLFQTPPSDDRSLLRPIERKAARQRKLAARAYWITTAFLP